MACTGGAMLVIHTANNLGLSDRALTSWLFVVYTLGGLFNLLLALVYKIPFAGAHSITAIAFLSTASLQLTLPQLTGSFLMAGLLIALLGFTGIFSLLFKHIPRPVIEAMLAGIIMHYVISLVPSFEQNPLVGLLAILGYFIVPRLIKGAPPVLGVIVFGLIGLLFTYQFPQAASATFHFPQWVTPELTLQGFVSVAIPVAILILSNDLAVAFAALSKNGYKPNINRTITLSGAATAIGSFFIGHSINLGGMMSTVCSSEEAGEHRTRYKAGVVSSVLCLLFGLFAWKLIHYITLLPSYFIAIIIGCSLLTVFMNSMNAAFSNEQYRFSVLFSFIISVAGITFWGISAALWSLIVGTIVAILLKENSKKETKLAKT